MDKALTSKIQTLQVGDRIVVVETKAWDLPAALLFTDLMNLTEYDRDTKKATCQVFGHTEESLKVLDRFEGPGDKVFYAAFQMQRRLTHLYGMKILEVKDPQPLWTVNVIIGTSTKSELPIKGEVIWYDKLMRELGFGAEQLDADDYEAKWMTQDGQHTGELKPNGIPLKLANGLTFTITKLGKEEVHFSLNGEWHFLPQGRRVTFEDVMRMAKLPPSSDVWVQWEVSPEETELDEPRKGHLTPSGTLGLVNGMVITIREK